MPPDIQFAIYVPNFGPFHSPDLVAEAAREAELAGWDGLFIWDHVIWAEEPVGDPWISLAAAASQTSSIRLGPVAVPVPRRRPWQIARSATSLDQLSGGRTVLGVGIGSDAHGDFKKFAEELDPGTRGKMLDEGLVVIRDLWSGGPVRFSGQFSTLSDVAMRPTPVQDPRIPIWVAGNWPRQALVGRATRCDGVVPQRIGRELSVDDVKQLRTLLDASISSERRFDVVHIGHTPDNQERSRRRVRELGQAGVTWWLENLGIGWLDPSAGTTDYTAIRDRIAQGPPR